MNYSKLNMNKQLKKKISVLQTVISLYTITIKSWV